MDEIKDGEIQDLKLRYPPIVVEDTRIPTLNYDENQPRLIISEIVNENFKSYGGIRTLGPFHKNFTCIIGPNGSGKSNVIDAMLFVFGFRASKIRSKKLSVLIHKSELFPNVQSCTVKVFFQRIIPTGSGDEDFEIVENSEFVVSRTAFKDNSNNYKINDKKVSTKEVSEFLRKQGIDLDHNRFLILQGEVEQISLMKPKATTEYDEGLLEYLEDIIGSNRFKNPINILAKREEELCVLRLEKLNRVKLVEKEKKDLEGVRNDALRYLRLCNEITIRKNIAFQIKCRELVDMEKNAKDKVDECKKEMEVIQEDLKKINTLKIDKEKSVKEIVQQHLMKMQEFEKSKKRFKDLEIEDATLRDNRKHCKTKLEETKKLIKSKEIELAKYENVPEESVSRIEQLSNELKNLDTKKQKEILDQEKAQGDLKDETKELRKLCDEKSSILRDEENLLLKQESKKRELKCERDLLLSNYTKEEERLARLEEDLKSTRENLKQDKEVLERLKRELPIMENDFSELNPKLEKFKKDCHKLQLEILEIQQQLESGSSSEIGEKNLKFLFEQQSLGKLKNIVGRLGDLASVDPKYDVALSTACGRLDNIVTETIDDAQKCVELMKRLNIGKASFIAIDKVNNWGSKADIPFTAPFKTPRAFDLLNIVDSRYKAVFYFALQNLLVAKDIDEARRINNASNTKYRIVTLKGELIESSGAMTGGGTRMFSGKISTSSDKVVAAAARRAQCNNVNRTELDQRLRTKRNEYERVSQVVSQLSSEMDTMSRALETARHQRKECDDQAQPRVRKEATLLQEIEVVQTKIKTLKPNVAQVTKLDKKLKELGEVYDRDMAKVDIVRKEVAKIKDDITNMGLAKLGCIKSRLDSIMSQIKEKSDTLKKINMSVKNAEKICSRTMVMLEELSKEKLRLEEGIIEMDNTLKELDIRATSNIQEYQKTQTDVDELSKVMESREKELAVLNEEYKNVEHSKKQLQRSLDERLEKLNQVSWSVQQIQGNIEKLKLFVIPEDCELADGESFADLLGDEEGTPGQGDGGVALYNNDGTQTLRTYSDEELGRFRVQNIGYQALEDRVTKQKPNLTAIEEYRLKEEVYMTRAAELTEVTELRDCQRRQGEQLRRQRLDEFLAGFTLITGRLKEMYQLITLGGDAELELVDTLDPFSEGIVFSVRPPKKSWKNIGNLSGGEKTLSSLALVFALHHFKPTPFYVMDEIDAALDFKNVSIVANYIKERTRNAQFIIISLRNNMYELADRLVGISKPFNFSKTCVLNPRSLERCLSAYSHVSQPSHPLCSQSSSQQQTPLPVHVMDDDSAHPDTVPSQ